MDLIQEIQSDAILFFKEMEDCQYTLDQPSLEFSKGKRNLEKLNAQIRSCTFPNIDDIIFNTCTKQESIDYLKQILHDLYSGQYDHCIDSIIDLFRVNRKLEKYEGGICHNYNVQQKTKRIEEGETYSWHDTYVPILLSHELTHAFFNASLPDPGFNYNYNELCPIFADHYAAYLMDNFIGENHLQKYMSIRLYATQQYFQEYDNMRNYYAELSKPNSHLSSMELAFKFSYYNSYQYIISTIYSCYLFELYLNAPSEILKDFHKTVTHEISVEHLLTKYNISLRNPETVQTFQKVLSQNSIS